LYTYFYNGGKVNMKSTVTARGQTAIPAEIRRRYNIKPNTKLEWIDDGQTRRQRVKP
jgi:AbrB family looped-hinge helix DNA binding protein